MQTFLKGRYHCQLRRSSRHPFPRQHRRAWIEPLPARADVPVVVVELEAAVAQFEDRDISRGANLERAAVPERVDCSRRVCGAARDYPVEGHAEQQEFREAIRKIEYLRLAPVDGPVGGDG